MRDKNTEIIDNLIKGNKKKEALELLNSLSLKIEDKQRYVYASFYRRLGYPNKALNLLHSKVIDSGKRITNATNDEYHEYILCCANLGLQNEAHAFLKILESKNDHRVFLQLGFLEIKNWNYSKAQNYLEIFLRKERDPFQRNVAKINLLSCFVHEGNTQTNALAKSLIKEWTKTKDTKLFLTHLYFQLIEYHYFKKDLAQAKEYFKILHSQLKNNNELNIWSILLSNEAIHKKVKRLKKISPKNILDFNARINLKFHEIYLSRDRIEFNKLYYSISNINFRNYLTRRTSLVVDNSSFHLGKKQYIFKVNEGFFYNKKRIVKNIPPKIKTLLQVFSTDMLRPITLNNLFNKIYSDHIFLGEPSLNSMNQLIHRTRIFLKDNDLPFSIECEKKHYYLTFNLQIAGIEYSPNQTNFELTQAEKINIFLKSHLTFKRKDLEKYLNISPRQTQYIIKELLEDKLIKAKGSARSLHYLKI